MFLIDESDDIYKSDITINQVNLVLNVQCMSSLIYILSQKNFCESP